MAVAADSAEESAEEMEAMADEAPSDSLAMALDADPIADEAATD